MLLERIRADEALSKFIIPECCENNISVSISEEIQDANLLILKIDDYYNSLNLERCPAAIDCLIIQKCEDNSYSLTLVELKNITSAKGFTSENMKEKFDTCLNDFMAKRFKNYFNRDYKSLRLYFLSNIEIYRRTLGLKLEILIQYSFNWRGRKFMIDPRMPVLEVKKC